MDLGGGGWKCFWGDIPGLPPLYEPLHRVGGIKDEPANSPEAVAGPTALSLAAVLMAFSKSGRWLMADAMTASTSSGAFCCTSSVSRGRNLPLWKREKQQWLRDLTHPPIHPLTHSLSASISSACTVPGK